jgi:hypothetical protein
LADCGNLKFLDLNCSDFGEKNPVLAMFYLLFIRKIFFDPNLRGSSPEKFVFRKMFCEKYGKNMEKLEKYGTVVILARM